MWTFFKKSKRKLRDVADNATKAYFDVTILKELTSLERMRSPKMLKKRSTTMKFDSKAISNVVKLPK